MSVPIKISIPRNQISPAIREKMDQMKPARLAGAVGPAVKRLTQDHLLTNGTNKRNWPTTHFWARSARATSFAAVDTGVVVTINQVGVRQRYFGGVIKPVNAHALTIPISPVSYGHVASDFPGLFLLKTKDGGAYLVQRGLTVSEKTGRFGKITKGGGNEKRRLTASLNFLFKLVSRVDQQADPTVLPSDKEYLDTAAAAVERSVN